MIWNSEALDIFYKIVLNRKKRRRRRSRKYRKYITYLDTLDNSVCMYNIYICDGCQHFNCFSVYLMTFSHATHVFKRVWHALTLLSKVRFTYRTCVCVCGVCVCTLKCDSLNVNVKCQQTNRKWQRVGIFRFKHNLVATRWKYNKHIWIALKIHILWDLLFVKLMKWCGYSYTLGEKYVH